MEPGRRHSADQAAAAVAAPRGRRSLGWRVSAVAVAVAAMTGTALAGTTGTGDAATRPSAGAPPVPVRSPWPAAIPYRGTPAVGALFARSGGKLRHYCSAAVVRSPRGDLAVTAAHCLQGRRLGRSGDVIFAPGYHSGRFPYGKWVVTAAFTDSRWRRDRDENDDVAFFTVAQDGRRIQKYTGAETLAVGVSLPQHVEVIGYPDAGTRPVRCSGLARKLSKGGYQQLVFACGGYLQGTSGGPFLVRTRRAEEIIGVIGGYERGGNKPGVSYSARFLGNIAALYRQAVS
jgi:V8-like Glu-specific endopeptidase